MNPSHKLQQVASQLTRTLIPDSTIDRARRVDQAISNDGKPMIDGREFFELTAPDKSVWRIRVTSDGTLTTKKVEGT